MTLFTANINAIRSRLLTHQHTVNYRNEFGNTALFHQTNPEIIKLLFEAGANINLLNHSGIPCFSLALPAPAMQLMIDYGADITMSFKYLNTSLHNQDDVQTVKLLLNNGANINALDDMFNTPLHYIEDDKCIAYLIEQGADLTILNVDDETPAQANFYMKDYLRKRAVIRIQKWSKQLRWYRLNRLVKTRKFCEWWYAPENTGGKIARKRLGNIIT
jgi:ankyrin repeat protein